MNLRAEPETNMSRKSAQSIEALVAIMDRSARFARESVRLAASRFGTEWQDDFAEMLSRLYGSEATMTDAVKGYSAFVMDSMRRQKRFEKELCYPARSYAEAAAEVYHNDDYMARQYLPGLLLSHYLWPHHYLQIQYFKAYFLSWLRAEQVGAFAEVGVGTGIYSRMALQDIPEIRGIGLDISAASLAFAQTHVDKFGLAQRYAVRRQNILEEPSGERFRAVICVEVLEHLEDPVALLKGLKSLCAPDGQLFVTAALNAANADHIYLYRRPEDVLSQADAAGLHVEHCFLANAYTPPAAGVPVPAALAMVLSPRN